MTPVEYIQQRSTSSCARFMKHKKYMLEENEVARFTDKILNRRRAGDNNLLQPGTKDTHKQQNKPQEVNKRSCVRDL